MGSGECLAVKDLKALLENLEKVEVIQLESREIVEFQVETALSERMVIPGPEGRLVIEVLLDILLVSQNQACV